MIPRLVSVVIPAYNAAAYIGEAVESVLAQTYPNLEILVVDDGSTDATTEVVARYRDRVRLLSQPNSGVASARNTGIEHARGQFVAFFDADDLWLPRNIELQVQLLERNPDAGLCYTGFTCVDVDLRPLGPPTIPPQSAAHRLDEVLPNNLISASSVVIRSVWLSPPLRFETTRPLFEDWDLWIRLAVAGCRFVAVPESLMLYRFHGSNSVADPEYSVQRTFRTLDRSFGGEKPLVADEALRMASYQIQHLFASVRYEHARNEHKAREHLRQALALIRTDSHPFNVVSTYTQLVWPAGVNLAPTKAERLRRVVATTTSSRTEQQPADAGSKRYGAWALLVLAKLELRSNPIQAARSLVQAVRLDPSILADAALYSTASESLLYRLRSAGKGRVAST